MDSIRCIIVDDEPLAIEILEEYIKKISWLDLVASLESGLEAIEFVEQNAIDLVFLDIQMPDLSGIKTAELLNNRCDIIFTTAYNQYAIEGFELEARDYLLKPISFDRFLKSVQRLKRQSSEPNQLSSDYIFVKTEYKIKKIRFDEICYVEGMKDYLRIVTIDEKVMTLLSFAKLIPRLPAQQFVRIHKSYVVAVDAIDSVEKGKVRVGEKLLPIGETHKETFLKLIGGHGL
ncbi:MAG: response regulator transcription factor [Roseivirga sp.]|nr:response regulator transcription factor [Roseivirga sp.]